MGSPIIKLGSLKSVLIRTPFGILPKPRSGSQRKLTFWLLIRFLQCLPA